MTDNTATKCEYTLLDNGIHLFTFNEGSLASADAFLSHMEQIYQARDENSTPLLVLADSANASLPISYSMQRGKELRDKYPNTGSVYTATLTSRIVEARLADSMMRLMRFKNTRMRFFDSGHRDEAIEWLLQQQ